MKRSQSITLLVLGVTLNACSDEPSQSTNYCDRSTSYYDEQKCDEQLVQKHHSYVHGGYTYHPWFRNNPYSYSRDPGLLYGWVYNSGKFTASPISANAPAISTAKASAVNPAPVVASAKSGSVAGASVARGGFGGIGAGVASGGE